jgi:hypothetical protein
MILLRATCYAKLCEHIQSKPLLNESTREDGLGTVKALSNSL